MIGRRSFIRAAGVSLAAALAGAGCGESGGGGEPLPDTGGAGIPGVRGPAATPKAKKGGAAGRGPAGATKPKAAG